ncbi:MAG: hypothetical protein NW241_06585 [Bacteroidia bacterium]|nr:hypothetical protein [Bacteroidia bacterium]
MRILNKQLRAVMKERKLLGVFLLFLVVFNYPIITLFRSGQTVGGIPVLYFAILALWLGMIGLMMLIIEAPRNRQDYP